MKKPEYQDRPLSVLRKLSKAEGDRPELWMWGPVWRWLTPEENITTSLDAISDLVGQGWRQWPHDNAHLESQLGQIIRLIDHQANEGTKIETWYKLAEGEPEPAPVILTFSIKPTPAEEDIPMLNPLPPPQLGEYALVGDDKGLLIYGIMALPLEAQQRWAALGDALKRLSTPLLWPRFTTQHQTASKQIVYNRELAALDTQRNLSVLGNTRMQYLVEAAQLQAAMIHINELHKQIEKETWLEEWEEIRLIAHDLARDYYIHHLKQQIQTLKNEANTLEHQQEIEQAGTLFPLQSLEKKTKQQRPTMQRTFDMQGYAPIVAAQPMQAIINSINNITGRNSEGWIFDEESRNAPYYPYVRDAGQTIIEYRRDEEPIQRDTRSAQALWEEVKSFDEQATDIILDIFSHLSRNMQDGAAWFFASEHLDNRQITPITKMENGKRRRAGHRKEDMLPISRTLSRLENLWLVINQQIDDPTDTSPKKKGKTARKKTRYTHTGRFLMVSQVWYQDELTGDEGESLVPSETRFPIGWYIRPGDWLRTFLEAPNYQVTQLCKTILAYDPYREKWEKAIARYLMFHGHMQCRGKGGVLSRRIHLILDEVSLPLNTSNPIKNRKNFEKAMNRLTEDAVIDGWCYENETLLPHKNWLNGWLDWSVKIYIASPQNKIQKGKQD